MKRLIIAFCTDSLTFKNNRIFNIKLAKKYPGESWIPIFANLVAQKGIVMTTGDIAISNVRNGKWNPKKIIVVQNLDAQEGKILIDLGSLPFLLFCLESPLYAYNFYQKVNKIAPIFENRVLFSGIFKTFKSASGNNYNCHFPSFNNDDILPITKWGQKQLLVMVAANKYYRKNFPILPRYLTEQLDWIKDKLWIWKSPIRRKAIKNQLITKRLEAIEYFGSQNLLHLFGPGWDKLDNLPGTWRKRLNHALEKINPRSIKDKVRTISNYKFAICFENTSYSGYVTEKIIDCFIAGVIPIYLGAPDIEKFVPSDSFVDMRNFKSLKELANYLKNMNSKDAQKKLTNGRRFLNSTGGQNFSHEFMAKFVFNLITSFSKSA